MPDNPPDALKSALAGGRALIVCGAGVSMAATSGAAPGWARLIKEGLAEATKLNAGKGKAWVAACEALLASDEIDDWLNAANTIQTKLGGSSSGPWRALFKQRLGNLKVTSPAILGALAKLADAGNRIATTNYDHLISHALHWDRADWSNHVRVIEALRRDPPAVWHLHGDYDHPESIIFSQADYDRIVERELPQFVQRTASLGFTLVFVGCSCSGLSDDNVGRLLEWLHKGFSGLGDKHFALTTNDNVDPWPAGVIPVRFGARDDLAAYLERLAPAPRATVSFPPDPRMIGREDRLKELVETVLGQERPVVATGALGMGKTTLALAAAWRPEVVGRFGRDRRFFINLEPVPDADGVARALAAALGLDASGAVAVLEPAIAGACAARPAFVILDNLETPWRNQSAATEAALGRLAAIAGLHLIVTVRGESPLVPGGGVTLRDVEGLGFDEARRLFLRHAGPQHGSDPALPALLQALDGHPLSIELVAANAAGKADLTGLVADWKTRRPEMFTRAGGDTRLTSLFVSLQISMDALGARSPAHRLVRAMALLPAGMAEGDCEATLASGAPTAAERAASAKLEKARLATRRNGRFHLLSPIREALLQAYPPETADKSRLLSLFLARAALGGHIGTAKWREVRESVTAEAGNFDAMIADASAESAPPAGVTAAVWGLAKFHSSTGQGSVVSLGHAVSILRKVGDVLGEANCIKSLGDIAQARSDHNAARAQYEEALPLYRKLADALGEANCIRSLGEIALARSDHEAARAQPEEALQLYNQVGDVSGEASCIFVLGNLALARSDHEAARAQFEEALPLYRKVGDVPGEANCIFALGHMALARSDHAVARTRFEEALPLYRKVGNVLGEANCNHGLGEIARAHSDHQAACVRFEAALPLYRQVGAVLGEAHCVFSLGQIARGLSDYDVARARFEVALRLYREVGAVPGEANCILSLGQLAQGRSDGDAARARFVEALPLYRKVGDVLGEANCINGLGEIAVARSDYEHARAQFIEALLLYRKIGAVRGEANCVFSIGQIAQRRSDCDSAHAGFAEALPLYRNVGDVLGEANCINGLGEIAVARSDHDAARARFVEALLLYRKIGSVLGEANCIRSFGDIAEARGDIAAAHDRYEEALSLYRKVGDLHGEANCIRSFGDIAEARHDIAAALRQWREALALYGRIPEPYSIGAAHLRLARRAATPAEAEAHREAAQRAWASIGRPDLIEKYLDGAPRGPPQSR